MLSPNCADLILVTYHVTENTVYHTASPQEYSLDSFTRLWWFTSAPVSVWISDFSCLCVHTCVGTQLVGWVTQHNFQKTMLKWKCMFVCGSLILQHRAQKVTCHPWEGVRRSAPEKKRGNQRAQHTSLIFSLQSLYCFFWLSRNVVSSFFCWATICCWNFFSSASAVFIWAE